ncbi:hypothetical protein BGW38_007321 [Lunasporangiospora selenospora]|uniref:Bestrophin, RFP-TM, chloride channel n=1 Tax=Lunasporangiospora selenospora TaxID=979761 RepID=A0A9P6FKS7_9FUNG|nr:hypothetical protein BGW38_007321 [Lunasporangiospora selenospora]
MTYFRRPAEYYKRTLWTYPDSLRIRGSVIPAILSDVFIISSFSVLVMVAQKTNLFGRSLNVPSVIVPALSVVVGLILAFRTNTAYDRYWEGRKLWANLDVQIRNFSRMIWVGMREAPHAPPPVSSGSSTKPNRYSLRDGHHLFGRSNSSIKSKHRADNGSDAATLADLDTVNSGQVGPHEEDSEKVLVIKLLLAYAVSVKHHLRQEFGVRYFDLEGLLPRGYEPCAATDEYIEARYLHDWAMGDNQRHYSQQPWDITAGNDDGQMSLPLEIAHGLSLWVIGEARAARIEPTLVGSLLSSINVMVDIFTNMERIVFTPIPLAYSIHLRQVVYLYCLALPFTFIDSLDWLLVPLMCLVSFTLFGVEAIGREIENPFGKDANDLHMDEFCRNLKRELDYTVNLRNSIPGAHV